MKTYAQNKEDTIVYDYLVKSQLIINCNQVCVEIGAWDGKHLSNTRFFIKHLGWTGYLYEANINKFNEIKNNYDITEDKIYPNCLTVSVDNIVGIVESTKPTLLSIDIDSDDYYLLEAILNRSSPPFNYKTPSRLPSFNLPPIVIIEYNPTLPFWMDIKGKPGTAIGCSFRAIQKLIGYHYSILKITESNLILINRSNPHEEYSSRVNPNLTRHLNTSLFDYTGRKLELGTKCYGSNPKDLSLDDLVITEES